MATFELTFSYLCNLIVLCDGIHYSSIVITWIWIDFVFISICKYLINAIFQELSLEKNDNLLSLWSFYIQMDLLQKDWLKDKFLWLKRHPWNQKEAFVRMWEILWEKKSLLNEMHINFVKYVYHLCQWQLDLLKHKLNLLVLFS